ncbi:MAG TPA: LOG family protein, partial [Opitutaceae bacterium]|nr:LOG family protein [Opitutaceae bacterium]
LRKPCVFLNQDGFYDDLLRFFDRMIAERFNKPSNLELFRVARTVDEVLDLVDGSPVAAETKWFETR